MNPDPALSPLLRKLVAVMGRRADDGELAAFVTGTLGQKVPATTTDVTADKNVVAKKHGLELCFGHDVKNDKYPLLPKSKTTFVPYLHLAWVTAKCPEPLPFGVRFGIGMSAEELASRLGPPAPGWHPGRPEWRFVLDPAHDVVLRVEPGEITIGVEQARALTSRHGVPARPVVGLFVAWAVHRGLLDESRLAAHAELLAAVRRRERPGSALVDAAFPRGVWDVHLRDEPGLRKFAHRWFHNIGGSYVRDDLAEVFGRRPGPHGHDEPALDADDSAAVDRATPALDVGFAQWVR